MKFEDLKIGMKFKLDRKEREDNGILGEIIYIDIKHKTFDIRWSDDVINYSVMPNSLPFFDFKTPEYEDDFDKLTK
jgi:hypothetical protein